MKQKVIFYFLFIVLHLACSEGSREMEKKVPNVGGFVPSAEFRKSLEFEEVKSGLYAAPLTVVGEVTFDEDNVVRIYPIVSGSVDRVYFSLGDYVKKGQLVATILSTDISTYQRDLSIARSNLDIAIKNLERLKALYASNFASAKEVQIAENEYANANTEYAGKKQILDLYGGNSKSADAVYNIYAPRSGYLVERKVNEGTQIRTDNADAIFTLSDLKSVWVQANVYESDYSRIHLGDMVEATTIAFPELTFSGKVEKINRILDVESRVIRVRTELANPGEKLLPGMYATINIVPALKSEALAIPDKAIFLERNEPHVIVKEKDYLVKRIVKTGRQFGNRIEVLEGLGVGETVVIKGALLVSNELNNRY